MMTYHIGGRIVDQKERFCGLEQGLKSSEKCFTYCRSGIRSVPSHEKEVVKEYCLKRAEDAGSSDGIQFLNDNK